MLIKQLLSIKTMSKVKKQNFLKEKIYVLTGSKTFSHPPKPNANMKN